MVEIPAKEAVREAVRNAVDSWSPGGAGLTEQEYQSTLKRLEDAVVRELDKVPAIHEIRTLRWKVKQLGKQVGKASQRIYELRCQLAEARSMVLIDKTGYRNLMDSYRATAQRNRDRGKEILELKARVRDLEGQLAATRTDKDTYYAQVYGYARGLA